MIIQGDCHESLKTIEDNSIQCIVTSPPYNKGNLNGKANSSSGNHIWKGFGINYDSCSDARPQDEYEKDMVDLFSSMYRVVKEGGSMFINHKTILKDKTAHFPKWLFDIRDWNLYQTIVWDRQCSCNIRKEVFFPRTEWIFWFTKGKKPKTHKDRCEFKSDIWRISPDKNNPHPATFPVELPLNCIHMTTDPGDVVLDPFSGSGTTGVASIMCGCEYIGFEISENYVNLANERIEKAKEKLNE